MAGNAMAQDVSNAGANGNRTDEIEVFEEDDFTVTIEATDGETPTEPRLQADTARPGKAMGGETLPASEGIGECAAILAVISTGSSSRIEREDLQNAAGAWFATAGDVAIGEGFLPGEDVWAAKVEAWAGQVSAPSSMEGIPEWSAYCAELGAKHGLSAEVFIPAPEPEQTEPAGD